MTPLIYFRQVLVDKGHEVHALVFGLIEQLAYPSSIVLDIAQGFQMLQKPRNHARHCCHSLEHDCPVAISTCKKPVCDEPKCLYETQRYAVTKVGRTPASLCEAKSGLMFSL